MSVVFRIEFRHVHAEDTRSVVHRAALQTRERQNCHVVWHDACRLLIFCSAGALVAHKVWVCAAKSGWASRLVRVDHYFVFGGLFHAVEIMVVCPLSVVIFSTRHHIAHISALYGVVSIFVHQRVCCVEVALIVAQRARSFVVHHQFDAFAVSILVEHCDVEVGVWSDKVKHIILFVAEPVFPSDVPSFHQQLVESVFGGKVDVTLHVVVVCTVDAVRLHGFVVDAVEVDSRSV